ncbi:hypothetical protein STRCI_006501 [Streptomyces cinnabarinus]|uniref:ATP-binding protein n=1 Tax=Streptomyces cinnabarinus TaxID=67287 RepID=A0ABY7KN93_9ACTN|nr:hypothetical protein [Streptomyces cinnabarinus]WAZ25038.1 hypothetical protein STRCI_006501 [Streptomyces cinnabarinus]
MLEVLNFSKDENGPRWRWRISGGGGSGERHESQVDLKASAESHLENYDFLTDLHKFMWHRRLDEAGEANTLRRLGHWLRTSVLTQEIWDRLPLGRPSTVLIRLDPDGPEREVLGYPLLLAADAHGSLVDRGLTFVHDVAAKGSSRVEPARRAEADAPLHLVGVFNRTMAGEPLDLHAEQSQVFAKVRDIAADGSGLDITTRTLSYHVTHDQLKDQVQSAKRSDSRRDSGRWQMILHLADRGVAGSWSAVSRTGAAGTKSPLSARELVKMLATGGNDQRLRLAVITTRPASSPSIADQLEMFRVPSHLALEPRTSVSPGPDGDGLAVELARSLGCAVLAFRHRIGDQAAVAFITKVYDYLLTQGLTLPRAVGAALAECRTLKTLDLAAPVIYGADACGLVVEPPPLRSPDPPTLKHPACSLIGHHDPMWKASEIFARIGGSEANGAVLHGMTGVGKEACARELIGQYVHRYRHVVEYPPEGRQMEAEPWEALCGFVGVLLEQSALRQAFEIREERVPTQKQLGDFLADDTAFERLCNDIDERLTNNNTEYFLFFLRDVGNLIAQTPRELGTPSANGHDPAAVGPWLDPHWQRLINAMTAHRAPGTRLLITSPLPLHLDQRRMPDVPVPLLSPAEAFLYAQSLPDLGGIISAASRDVAGEDQRKLVHIVLARAEGHPGLLRFADKVASEPDGTERLQRLATVDGDALGQDTAEPIPDDWRLIEEWAVGALRCIPRRDPRHLLLLALSWLSSRHRVLHPDDDCAPGLLAEVWAGLRGHRQRLVGQVPDPEGTEGEVSSASEEKDELRRLLESLADDCLVDCLLPTDGMHVKVRMQPAVATAVRRHHETWLDTDGSLRAEVDRIAIRHTAGRVKVALRHRTHGRTADVQRLIPEAMPYLERASDWETWLHFVAVRMTRPRRGPRGLDDTVRKLERVTADIRDKGSDQFKMAHRLGSVFKAIDEGERPGLSVLLGKGPGDPVVDDSPLAMAMSVGILSGLRDTGRLSLAREVALDYLKFCDSGTRASLVADAVEVELLRVMVDEGKLSDALNRIPLAFESLADVRFRDAVHSRWADGEILRKKLFTIRRDTHIQLAEAAADGTAYTRHLRLARADHERLGQYLVLEGPDTIEEHLHTVEGCLLALDVRLSGDRDELEKYDDELVSCLRVVEHSGDVIVQAMTDAARARIKREQAARAIELNGERAGHSAMQAARDYELKALRLLYAQGTPMDIGACHRRIGDDQLACEHESLKRSTPAHHMYAALLGRLTGAHVLRQRDSDSARWRRDRSERGVLPATVEELCGRVREVLFAKGKESVPGALDPEGVLRKLADDGQVERAFRGLSAES